MPCAASRDPTSEKVTKLAQELGVSAAGIDDAMAWCDAAILAVPGGY